MTARFIVGDVFGVLATLPDDSVDLVFSSPPFLALRSYLPADHPDKAKEIGSEATPADFLDTLLDVVEACDRVLAPHGSLVFELGDTFAGSGGAGGDYNEGGLRADAPKFSGSALSYRKSAQRNRALGRGGRTSRPDDVAAGITQDRRRPGPEGRDSINGWPLDKSLCMIPGLFAASLAYGRNLLRPERLTPPWRIRNLIVWARPNPPVGALGDKFRPATSYLTVACKLRTRYFDLDAVRTKGEREPHTDNRGGHKRDGIPGRTDQTMNPVDDNGHRIQENAAGAPPLDYWVIPTHPYPGSHYATFPPDLVVKPVKAMCPARVCRVCGEPSRRITSEPEYVNARSGEPVEKAAWLDGELQRQGAIGRDNGSLRSTETLGWTDCGHDDRRAGVVLDPFAGSGTTLAVATGHGLDTIGIDIDSRNADLALERVGPLLLTVEQLPAVGVA